jgi:hypothetical protein
VNRRLLGVGRRCLAGLVCLAALSGCSAPKAPTTTPEALRCDRVCDRARLELARWIDWLTANHAQGYLGEVGWPDGSRGDGAAWNVVAEACYQQADAARLWVTVWAAGERWPATYPLAAYKAVGGEVSRASSQAAVIERHRRPGRGISVAGGEFAAPAVDPTSGFSNAHPGVYGHAYQFATQATFHYLAGRGLELVRIPFRWERLQPQLGHPLDTAELGRLQAVVARARHARLGVVLDLHNYGGYYGSDGPRGTRWPLGSPQLPIRHFTDLWSRLSAAFAADPAVVAYGLMNEPALLAASGDAQAARLWERASQAALLAIRARGDRKLVTVAGYNWSAVASWPATHPSGWIDDPAHNFHYEAHQYFDSDHSGRYALSYSQELARAGG